MPFFSCNYDVGNYILQAAESVVGVKVKPQAQKKRDGPDIDRLLKDSINYEESPTNGFWSVASI